MMFGSGGQFCSTQVHSFRLRLESVFAGLGLGLRGIGLGPEVVDLDFEVCPQELFLSPLSSHHLPVC